MARLLGHSEVATTLRLYAHALRGGQEAMADRINATLGGPALRVLADNLP